MNKAWIESLIIELGITDGAFAGLIGISYTTLQRYICDVQNEVTNDELKFQTMRNLYNVVQELKVIDKEIGLYKPSLVERGNDLLNMVVSQKIIGEHTMLSWVRMPNITLPIDKQILITLYINFYSEGQDD